ncbi:hypothetical protein O6H91_05G018600 [Diphasiastrum complanatum]|uniref:Uncharacterized protein n=1 Tax=Diphasiastrum complanatum TaxID=34168 RepID=A0ACC2DLC6_DIPCM|nr:hypothetical protein O6H91_05G018600 [Diphasiastrum complanatum]
MPKDLSKDDVERVIVQLVLSGFLKEEFQHTAYATNAYVTIGARHKSLILGQQKVILEVHGSTKVMKHAPSTVHGPVDESILQSEMAHMLDRLRQELASAHGGIFPYSILSSQHIGLLCLKKPHNLTQVEEVIGKQKAELYGKEILTSIKKFLAQNPESSFSAGKWTSPKNNRSRVRSRENQPSSGHKKLMSPKQSVDIEKKEKRKLSYIIVDKESDSEADGGTPNNNEDGELLQWKRLKQ